MSAVTVHSTDTLTVCFCEGPYNTTNNILLFLTNPVNLVTECLSSSFYPPAYPTRANIFFTLYSKAKSHIFFLITNQTFNSSAIVLLFGCFVLCYILDVQLFLQPQPISHRQHIMSQLQIICLWPQRPTFKNPSISQSLL
jgi:hypothetical protein